MPPPAPEKVLNESIIRLREAEELLQADRDGEAGAIYRDLISVPEISALSYYRLGEIFNRAGKADEAYRYHRRAFAADPRLASRILRTDHVHYHYVYRQVEQVAVTGCPLCAREGRSYWAFNMLANLDFNAGFDPVRLWNHCSSCHHLFAAAYPSDLARVLAGSANQQYSAPDTKLLAQSGRIISGIRNRAPGLRFLEVGVGAGEQLAVAREMGFDVTGLEIRPVHAAQVSARLNIQVICKDFLKFEASPGFDVISLGDVLEHMPDPVRAIGRCNSLLDHRGILWISTPNFESAFSVIMRDRDPMKKVCEHLNYFSYGSLERLLTGEGFKVVDYQISRHYSGSMEITAVKENGTALSGGRPPAGLQGPSRPDGRYSHGS
ncbi:MAG: class I SAM-dependent methyltransferase [Candidatus Krumholzibacteriota bacterium]|nr:class I SAM-dependent methyltransferase [Candidatus Krumholzibacteriota bacterium]